MKALGFAMTVGAVLAFSAGVVQAQPFYPMDGLQETPPNASPGSGQCVVGLTGLNVNVLCDFTGLIAPANNAHIHRGPVGGPAGPAIIGLSFTPSTSGTVSGGGALSAADVANLEAGLLYVNLHSSIFPSGEIRGQIPEPASLSLLAVGGLLLARRTRRSA